MNTRLQTSKLLELRAKTDRQLVEFITSRVNAGLTWSRLVTDPESRNRWASTGMFLERACQAYSDVRPLLPLVGNLETSERRILESKVDQLRRFVEEHSQQPACAACF